MATWIFILHLFLPTAPGVVDAPGADLDEGLRYRGVEAMFAKFEAEAESDGG